MKKKFYNIMQKIFHQEKINNSAFCSYNNNYSALFLNSKIEKKNFCPEIIFNNIDEEKVETSNSSQITIIPKEEDKILENKQKVLKKKYIVKNKKNRFRIDNTK